MINISNIIEQLEFFSNNDDALGSRAIIKYAVANLNDEQIYELVSGLIVSKPGQDSLVSLLYHYITHKNFQSFNELMQCIKNTDLELFKNIAARNNSYLIRAAFYNFLARSEKFEKLCDSGKSTTKKYSLNIAILNGLAKYLPFFPQETPSKTNSGHPTFQILEPILAISAVAEKQTVETKNAIISFWTDFFFSLDFKYIELLTAGKEQIDNFLSHFSRTVFGLSSNALANQETQIVEIISRTFEIAPNSWSAAMRRGINENPTPVYSLISPLKTDESRTLLLQKVKQFSETNEIAHSKKMYENLIHSIENGTPTVKTWFEKQKLLEIVPQPNICQSPHRAL